MSRVAFGFWACAAVYAAVGIIGVFLLGAQPSIAYSSDGYGMIAGSAAKHTALKP